MKTAAAALQEMMVKLKEVPPEYECIAQSGPHHLPSFEYRCKARGCTVTASALTKKEAKQEAAKVMLLALKARGEDVPPPFDRPPLQPPPIHHGPLPGPAARSYVSRLTEMCVKYNLPAAEYELVSATGPPHMREFTVRVALAQHVRLATAKTKQAARQQAAQQLYSYLRNNHARLTPDFEEEDILIGAHARVMERYVEATRDEAAWRPDPGQRVADYHLGVVTYVDAEKCALARDVVEAWYAEGGLEVSATQAVEAAAAALGVEPVWSALPAVDSGVLCVLELGPLSPAVALAGRTRAGTAVKALRFLRLSLRYPAPPPRAPAAHGAAAAPL